MGRSSPGRARAIATAPVSSRRTLLAFLVVAGVLTWGVSRADEPASFEVTIKDHRFAPSELHVPAGKAVILTVNNQDATAEEFESGSLKVEKVIAGKQSTTVRIRPLEKGRYPFVGEYHQTTAQGVVVAE